MFLFFSSSSLLRVIFFPSVLHLIASEGRIATDDSETKLDAGKTSIKLKVGALFDVGAGHLTETFQAAVGMHNRRELGQDNNYHEGGEGFVRSWKDDGIKIILEPVITFVDVTDSFAVSNAMCDLIAQDVIAIIGVTNSSSLPTIQSYSATFHVPFLSLGSSQNVTSAAPFQLSLRPPIMAAVVDLLQHKGCASALYLYDTDEGLLRIQDLFQTINIGEIYLELDIRRIGDKVHVAEISKVISSLHPRREICLALDVERLDAVAIIKAFALGALTVKDIILVTLDAEMVLDMVVMVNGGRPASFNVSGLQLVPSLQFTEFIQPYPNAHQYFQRMSPSPSVEKKWSYLPQQKRQFRRQLSKDFVPPSLKDPAVSDARQQEQSGLHSNTDNDPDSHSETNLHSEEYRHKHDTGKTAASSEALIVDCLKVLTTALAELWDSYGDVFTSNNEDSREDISIKCTSFVVEKKQYGAELMEALKLVHLQGKTRYIRFDTSGKREDYTLGVLSLKAGSNTIRNEGEWSSVSGLTSHMWSRDGVKSYTIFGNMSGYVGRKVLIGFAE